MLSATQEVTRNNGNTAPKESTQTSASGFLINVSEHEDAVGDGNERATVENEREDDRQLVVFRDTDVDTLLRCSDVCTTNPYRNSDSSCNYPQPKKGEEGEDVPVSVPYCCDPKEEKERRESLGEDVAYS